MHLLDPVKAREFAVEAVRRLREAGYEALWAGGCVRDKLMGREPKDYDVATSATPEQIRAVFGRRHTLPIGASFGVICLVGPRSVGQIDVATFRRDATYSDGRHPDSVTFSDAREDALRRDFTINGLFFDPIDNEVLDYVGGQQDLERCIVRAIGDARARFAEDKLRVLRAVRFAATLGFEIAPETWQAVRQSAKEVRVVSAERVTEELRRMLVHPARPRAVELLRDADLLHAILPEAEGVLPQQEPADEGMAFAWDRTLRILEHLNEPTFPVALAALWREIFPEGDRDTGHVQDLQRRWRLKNDDAQVIRFCLEHERLIRQACQAPWPRLQRVLIHPLATQLLCYAEAVARVIDGDTAQIRFCGERLEWPPERLNPAPFVGGHDLHELGIPAGPLYRELLERVRDEQLLGHLATREAARDWVREQWAARKGV